MKSCCLPSHGVQLVSPTAFKTWIRGNHCWVIEYATGSLHVISAWSLSNLSFKGSVNDYNAHFIFHKLKGRKMPANSEKPLQFSKLLKSRWLTNVQDEELRELTIVVNISNSDAVIASPPPRKVLKPRKSTILQGNACRMRVPCVPIFFAAQLATVVRRVQPLPHPRLSRRSSGLWNLKVNVDRGENVFVSTRVF